MKILFILCIFSSIINVYCSLYNTGVEEIAALILSASTNDKKIKRSVDGSEIKVNISDVKGVVKLTSIINIIPGLRKIKNKYEMKINDYPDRIDELEKQNDNRA